MQSNYTIETNENQGQEYYWFKRGFSREQLKKLFTELESIPFEEASTFGDADARIRKSKVKWLPQDHRFEWLYDLINELAIEANNTNWKFDIHTMLEQIQYTEYYAEAGGHYTWHQDIGPGHASKRKISVTIQLSDDNEYEGGDLEIWRGGDSIQAAPRGAGVSVLFPSYMMHRVTPVTRGTRKSLVLWIGGSHYK
jgi:PKHD-type hydroxylase|tara:strand:- start:71 stop:658 length:588 start_codon:yes stop_codon:yes gene_type:complete